MVHVLLNSCTLEHDLLKCKMVWCLYLPIHIEVTHKNGFPTLNNSRAIILKCFMGSGWLLNLAKRLSQQTISQSLMMIH